MQEDGGYGPLPRRRGSGSLLSHAVVGSPGGRTHARPCPGALRPGVGRLPTGKRRGACSGCSAPSWSSASHGEQDVVSKVKQGLVIINTALQYNSEAAAGIGMVINSDGLVLTNNHVIEDSTKITATVISTGMTRLP